MRRRGTIALFIGLAVLLGCGLVFNAHRRVLLRRHGVYPIDQRLALADGGGDILMIARDERVVYRLSPNGRLMGPVAIWARGDIKGVALIDRVKIEDDRYGYTFAERSVVVTLAGNGSATRTIELATDW
jgi:hypothetical protein